MYPVVPIFNLQADIMMITRRAEFQPPLLLQNWGLPVFTPVPTCPTMAPRTANVSNFCLEMDPVYQGNKIYLEYVISV